MAQKISRWQKFKKFLKRNMTPTWAKHFSYQVFAFLVSLAMVFGVATYAFSKSYDERELTFVDNFTITAHTGAFDTKDNTLETVEAAIKNNVDVLELDIRQRPDGTLVMGHDIIVSNSDGVEISAAFDLIKDTNIYLNLDIKEMKVLPKLHKMLIEYGLINRAFLTGIEYFQAKDVPEKCPDVAFYINYIPSRIKIFSDDYQQKILDILDKTGAIGINCNHTYASRTLSEVLHKNGYKLSVWTVDKKRHMKRALVNKPDNITTHNYNELLDLIENWGK